MQPTVLDFYTLVKDEAAAGHTIELTINSGSMRPFLHDGQRVLLAAARHYRHGDMVLALTRDKRVLLHAITANPSGPIVTLRGTANLYASEECNLDDIAARVVGIEDRSTGRFKTPSRLAMKLWPSSPLLRRILLRILP